MTDPTDEMVEAAWQGYFKIPTSPDMRAALTAALAVLRKTHVVVEKGMWEASFPKPGVLAAAETTNDAG